MAEYQDVIMAGFGGQGVMLIGNLLAQAGMEQGLEVSFIPVYGAEMRGGTANCTIKVSDGAIASPYSKAPDIVCALNAPAVDKFESSIKPGGWLFINDSLVPKDRVCREDINVVRVPMSEIAVECGNPKGANLVLLGAVAAHTGLFKLDELEEQVTEYFARKGKINPKNSDCLYAGAKL